MKWVRATERLAHHPLYEISGRLNSRAGAVYGFSSLANAFSDAKSPWEPIQMLQDGIPICLNAFLGPAELTGEEIGRCIMYLCAVVKYD